MIIMVACRPAQHSAMLGQPASSHTVTRPCSRRISRVSANCGEDAGTFTRIQSGLRSTGVSGLWAFSGCRGRLSRMVTIAAKVAASPGKIKLNGGPRIAGTRRASPAARSWHGRGCDGYAGASRQPGSRYRSGSGRPREGLPGSLVRLPETLLGSLGRLAAPRDGVFCPVTHFIRRPSMGVTAGEQSRDSWLGPCISTRPLASSPSPCHADCC